MKVKDVRKRNNMTQQEFADKLGLKRTTYATYEQESIFPVDVLQTIAHEFGVPYNELLDANHDESQVLLEQANSMEYLLSEKNRMIELLERVLNDKDKTEKALAELKASLLTYQERYSAALTKCYVVQEFSMKFLAKLSKVSIEEMNASVRIREAELRNLVF